MYFFDVYKQHLYCIMAARVQRAVMPGWISRLSEIDKDVVFKIVIELKKAKGWKRIQWKAVAEHYIRETGKDATPDKAFQKKVRRAFKDYVYDSKKHLHDAYEHYKETGDTSLLKEVLFVDSVGKLDINVPIGRYGWTTLYAASSNGHAEVVSMLLAKQGVDVNQAENHGITPLLVASEMGHAEVVSMLLATQGIDVNQALYTASYSGHADVVRLLLAKQDIDVNQADKDGSTPLYGASHFGHAEVVSMLLATQDIDVNKDMNDGATPLFIASVKGHAEVVSMLLAKQDIDVNKAKNNGATPLLIASEEGHAEVVSMLLAKQGVDANQAMNDGATPLYIASQNDHAEVVAMLLAKQGVDVNQAKDNGTTPLLIASYSGHADVVRLLLAAPGVDVNKTDDDGTTPLYIASQKGHSEVVSMLLAMPGIDVNKATPSDKNTPLLVACKKGHLPVVKKLLARADILPNEADNNGKTPLIFACMANNGDIVHELINDSRVDPNKGMRGWPPLTMACEKGLLKAVEAMLGSPMVDVNKTTPNGVTAIFIACQNGHTKVVTSLLRDALIPIDINAKRDSDDYNPLLIACERKKVDIVKALMNADTAMITSPLDFTAETKNKETALHCAIRLDRSAIINGGLHAECLVIVKMLLKPRSKRLVGTKLNAKTDTRETALFWACETGQTQVVAELIKHKNLKLNSKNGSGEETALVAAVRKKHVDIVKMLLDEPGIRPNTVNTYDDTCFEISLANYNSEISLALLTWAGGGLSNVYKGANDSIIKEKTEQIEQAYTTGHSVTRKNKGDWELVIQDETFLIHQIDTRVRPSVFRDLDSVPTKTFTLNARDVTMFTDEIKAPVRCVPCQHPHEASSLRRWFNTPMNPNNPNRLHKGCPLCQQEPDCVEFMSDIQVLRWNNMEDASSEYEQELNRLRHLLEKSSSMGVYKQFQASTVVRESNEAKAQELEKERKDIEEQIRKLREKRGEVLHAASDVQAVVDRTNVTLATLQSQLDRDQEFKKNVDDREAARKAVDKNKLQNRYTPGKNTMLKF